MTDDHDPDNRRADVMMTGRRKSANAELVAELHRRQGEMYAGGPIAAVLDLLTDDIVWHVPGTSPIAGDHRGARAVAAYFERRRELAQATMELHPGPLLADRDAVVQLVDGSAKLGGKPVSWRTAGVYRIVAGHVAEVWLVPLDLELFDRLWSPYPPPTRRPDRIDT